MTDARGSWSETKARLKRKFAMLTDSDMFFTATKREAMVDRLQAKLGKTKEEIRTLLNEL